VKQLTRILRVRFAVYFISENRRPIRLHMNADLMSSSRKDLAKNKRPVRFLEDYFKMSTSRTSTFDNGHLLPMDRVTTDRRINLTA